MKALMPARHTGRPAPHTHTSYAGLLFVLLLTALTVAAFSWSASAGEGDTSGGDSAGIFASVPAKVPGVPTIAAPVSGTSFDDLPVVVTGSCTSGSTVKIFKDGIMAGSAICASGGTYRVSIDLFYGNNTLTAQGFNAQDIGSASSPAVGVRFVPISGPLANQYQAFTDTSRVQNQLYIKSDTFHRATATHATPWRIELVGGLAPYAVSVSWGDGSTDVYSRLRPGVFEVAHTYADVSRSYDVVVKASDAAGHNAYLQLVSVGAVSTAPVPKSTGALAVAWPLLGVAGLAVLAFWMGERHEKTVLGKPKPA